MSVELGGTARGPDSNGQTALAHLVELDENRAVIIDAALNQTVPLEFTLSSLALAAARAVVQSRERRAVEDFSSHAPNLAMSLNNLSVGESGAGRPAAPTTGFLGRIQEIGS